jgi:hypothetical protein
MSRTERILLALLVIGVWALVAVACWNAEPVQATSSLSAYDVDGLEEFVEDIVEDCVVSGEVQIYDPASGYGELESVQIDC